MIRTKSIIVADTVIVDRLTNRLSIINTLEQLRAASYPVLLPSVVVLAILEREMSDDAAPEATMRIRLDDDVVFEGQLEVNFETGRLTRAVNHFQGFLIPKPGDVRIELQVGDDIASSHVITAFPPPTSLVPHSKAKSNKKAKAVSTTRSDRTAEVSKSQ